MKTDSIVVAIDFGAPATAAARWVATHFAPSAALTLVHVVPPADRPRFASGHLPDAAHVEALAREDAEARLRELAAWLTAAPTRCIVRTGRPHEEIAAVAREVDADLVVIGPHGDRPTPSGPLGTTADRIARTAPVSVLVVRAPRDHAPRNLLVPVDDAPITPALLGAAHELADRFDAEITLLHVWSDTAYGDVQVLAYAGEAHGEGGWSAADTAMRNAGARWLLEMASTGIAHDRVSAAVTHGTPGRMTLEMADAIGADLIVLGRQGAGLVVPMLLGSTVGTVVKGANCPVLVVAGPLPGADLPW